MKTRTSISLVTKPATQPVTVAEAKAWAKIDIAADDAMIGMMIEAATTDAEMYTRRSFITQTHKLTMDALCSGIDDMLGEGTYDLPVSVLSGGLPSTIELPKPPLQSISSVQTYTNDGTAVTFNAANYYADTAGSRLSLKNTASWPSDLRHNVACEVTYIAGYGDATAVPMPIKTAILMHVQDMYDKRIICDMPDACASLLNRYRIYG